MYIESITKTIIKGDKMKGKVSVVVNHKGGVGKSVISTNLPYALAKRGKKTLLIDLDPQGHSCKTYCFERTAVKMIGQALRDKNYDIKSLIEPAKVDNNIIENLDVIPSHLNLALIESEIANRIHVVKSLKRQIDKIKSNYDSIIVDCPPTLGVLTQNAVFAADNFIIPINYDDEALEGIVSIFSVIDEVKDGQNYEFHILRNDRDLREKIIVNYIEEQLSGHIEPKNIMQTVIRHASSVKQARVQKEPMFTYDPQAAITKDFESLASEYIEKFIETNVPEQKEEIV